MHHIDRTLQEFESGAVLNGEFENDETNGEYGQEIGYEFEFEQEFEQGPGQEFSGEFGQEALGLGPEQEQLEAALVGELLEVSTEQELNQFLGSLMSQAVGAASRLAKSPAGQSVGQYLVDFGKKTLPQLATRYGGQAGTALGSRAGGALGGRLGPLGARAGAWAGSQAGGYAGQRAGQWAGTQAGNWLATNAQRVFGLELEALSPESQELEIARSFVRFATDVTRRANQALRRNPNLSLGALGKQVLMASVPRHAPGLRPGGAAPQLSGGARRARQGTWERRGRAVVLYDV